MTTVAGTTPLGDALLELTDGGSGGGLTGATQPLSASNASAARLVKRFRGQQRNDRSDIAEASAPRSQSPVPATALLSAACGRGL